MKCPICNAWTEVLRTDGTRRRRECANGHRFTTQEVVVPDRTQKEAARGQAAHSR
jgi:transcriptional regulator NrdR family protein